MFVTPTVRFSNNKIIAELKFELPQTTTIKDYMAMCAPGYCSCSNKATIFWCNTDDCKQNVFNLSTNNIFADAFLEWNHSPNACGTLFSCPHPVVQHQQILPTCVWAMILVEETIVRDMRQLELVLSIIRYVLVFLSNCTCFWNYIMYDRYTASCFR